MPTSLHPEDISELGLLVRHKKIIYYGLCPDCQQNTAEDALVERLERRYQPHIAEQAQIAVDGAEAYLRQLGAHTRIYRVRSRVIASRFYDFQNSITL